MSILALITTLLPAIVQGGSILVQLFPQFQSIFNALSGTNPTAHTNIVSYMQEALNALQSAGVISFGNPLVVDGNFGLTTFKAIKAIQSKVPALAWLSQEPLATIEYNIIKGLLPTIAGNVLPPPARSV